MTIIKQFLLFTLCFFLVKTVQAYGNDNAERSRICSTYDDQNDRSHHQQRGPRVDGERRTLRRQYACSNIQNILNRNTSRS